MANLIDATFFVGEINIPNTHKTEILEKLNLCIGEHETELLVNLLGKELYTLYLANPDDERFVDITNQLIYEINGQKYSLIAYYVYWFWMKDNATWSSGFGVIRPTPDTATEISPALKMVSSWNKFSEKVCQFQSWLDDKQETYPEWEAVYYPYYNSDYARTNDFDI